MSFEDIRRSLGGFPSKAGTPTLTPLSPPGQYSSPSIYGNPTPSDLTAFAEERVVYPITPVPHDRHSDGGVSGDELISEGDLLFGVRANSNDVRVATMELSFVNVFLAERYEQFKKLFSQKVLVQYQTVVRKFNPDEVPMSSQEVESILPTRDMTLQALCEAASHYENEVDTGGCLPFRSSVVGAYVPSEDELYACIKKHESYVEEIVAPDYTPDGLEDIWNTFISPATNKSAAYSTLDLKQKYRTIIKLILAAHSEITQYVILEGIKERFNFLGILVSSQDDGTPQGVLQKNQTRQFNISCHGPTEVTNRWNSCMITNSALFLVLKRMRHTDKTFGEFYFQPYNSSDNAHEGMKAYPFGSNTPEGPKFQNNTRRKQVPTHETAYLDISGVLHTGHVIYVGRLKDQINQQETHEGRILSLGLKKNLLSRQYSAYDTLLPNNYQIAYDSRVRRKKIMVYVDV